MARWGLVILPFAALVSLVVVALTSSSPSEITDRTRVSAEPVTYTVGPRVLQSHLVVRGAKHLRDRADVLAPPAAEGNRPVLTSLAVTVDATVSPCGLIGSVADRPIIAVAGVIQPYRDLRPGDVGTDVAQLRTALAACGHLSDDPPGVFGPTTTQAILDVYASIGFPPLTTQGTMGQLLASAPSSIGQRTMPRVSSDLPPETPQLPRAYSTPLEPLPRSSVEARVWWCWPRK